MTAWARHSIKQERGRRHILRPRSITGLLLGSFALVALPLVAATLYGVFYVDRLSGQSERLVLRGVQTARASKKLDTTLTDMERDARQYKILGNDILADRFFNHKADFDHTLKTLGSLETRAIASWNLDTLSVQANSLAAAVREGPNAIPRSLNIYNAMHKEVALITQQGNNFIDSEIKRLQDTARSARRFLFLCLVMLVPGVILLAIIFALVISRPVRQITGAINRLGQGDFEAPIHVSAPSVELDTLGRQLDWMRRQLATLENERNVFLRRMSHELKTPLASIREGIELLHDGTVGTLTPGQSEVADIIRHNSMDLMLLIENLLDFSAWQQKQARLEYTECDLQALSKAVAERQQLSINHKNLTVSLPDQPIGLVADRDRLHLIIDNLLSNAVKFSPRGGTITIAAAHDANQVELTVSDSGPGIQPEERELVFEAFYRTRNAQHNAHIRGTGIGLSVVQECVKAHGGTIDLSDNPGGGACFRVTLPAEQ